MLLLYQSVTSLHSQMLNPPNAHPPMLNTTRPRWTILLPSVTITIHAWPSSCWTIPWFYNFPLSGLPHKWDRAADEKNLCVCTIMYTWASGGGSHIEQHACGGQRRTSGVGFHITPCFKVYSSTHSFLTLGVQGSHLLSPIPIQLWWQWGYRHDSVSSFLQFWAFKIGSSCFYHKGFAHWATPEAPGPLCCWDPAMSSNGSFLFSCCMDSIVWAFYSVLTLYQLRKVWRTFILGHLWLMSLWICVSRLLCECKLLFLYNKHLQIWHMSVNKTKQKYSHIGVSVLSHLLFWGMDNGWSISTWGFKRNTVGYEEFLRKLDLRMINF